ncbi:flavin-containing monooxygenase [Mycobacteroides abscessus]|uniref:flavin-containing monooxygenase n=1 Tax=Mycobacteroides abscessus TaxID=36809 RepID=UPI0009A7F09B|nr:NAD(P)/FAD-dependent oxidoreductase [Mycobacteroides abscessus]SKG07165.1 monooxygenase [Mycobacteroides abscessus subsp. massiliense]SKG90158.1 monooxygenase [Mycobacteroides abscessus subsp. massiliense]SKI00317.1 monooxygenase [Mycobacteroides abscessus subsp. massiliense]SKI95726.1 monooxygenase [Mycobacteroides abscessus subsp. massiliense]SKJ11553.1 monooxygenase [Mycobacteroides abscessus subsp. massiliense]
MSDTRDPRVIVVGAGMAGIAVGHKLKEAGFNDFTILEKGDDVGGVWYWNRYPGLTCDVPSQAYQYPFAPRTDWPRLFATGSEIQAYHRQVAEDLDVMPHIRCGQEVTAAEFTGSGWRVTTAAGEALECDFLIAATGVLHHPNIPDIPGLDSFQGAVVHTARWDDSVRLEGKRVAAIGTGSTGVQVVSAMQPVVAQVTSFIRTPQWVLWAPMSLRQPKFVGKLLDALPTQRIVRFTALTGTDALVNIVTRPGWGRRLVQQYARACLHLIRDKELRQKLTPDYEPLCKRQVLSGSFHRAVQKPNAEIVTDRITRITPTGIVTVDGTEREFDVIVLATGFQAHNYMRPMNLVGKDGYSIDEAWEKGPKAYRMTAIPGFPNFFTVLGPNSPTGSIWLQHTAERTAEYIISWLHRFARGEINTVEVSPEATDEFNDQAREAMKPTVWATGCNSWYLTEDGSVDLWPFDRKTMEQMLASPEESHYIVR